MNKQEFISKLRKILTKPSEGTDFDYGHDYGIQRAIYLAEDLDEQQETIDKKEKPVVPQYVADFYESIEDDFEDGVYGLCAEFYEEESELSTELYWWFKLDVNKPIETLVKMKLYGYEVEHEQRYVVAIPDDARDGFIQLWKNRDGKLFFNFSDKIRYGEVHLLTEQEIKQKDERLWQFAKGVEE